jgi:hypothetical protein
MNARPKFYLGTLQLPPQKIPTRQAHATWLSGELMALPLRFTGDQTLSGLRCLTINIIGRAGYGQKQAWSPELQDHKGKDARSVYFKTISLVADRFEWAAFVPTKLLKMPFMSRQLQSLGCHKERMPAYTKHVLEEEQQASRAGYSSQNNFLSMLVESSDQEKRVRLTSHALSDDEISENLFIISTAGFETTANIMGMPSCTWWRSPNAKRGFARRFAILVPICFNGSMMRYSHAVTAHWH